MNLRPAWEPTDADLVAHLLDDLAGARAEYVAAHLQQCQECRARLANLRRAFELLETLPEPDGDNHRERSMLVNLIESEATRSTSGYQTGRLQQARVGLTAIALLIVAILLAPALASAVSVDIRELIGIERELNPTTGRPRILSGNMPLATVDPTLLPARPTIEPADLTYAPVVSERLPGSNHLVGAIAYASGAFEAYYQGDDGLQLLVTQAPATSQSIRYGEWEDLESVQIEDVEAAVLMDDDLNSVSQLFWVRGGMLFSLQALVVAHDKFPLMEAIQVVERLIDLQDHPAAS